MGKFVLLVCGAFALASVVPLMAPAQELSGVLTLSDGRSASGVLVVAVRPGTGVTAGRAVAGESGRFNLRLPAGTYLVRALRIGHAPSNLGEFTLAAGERRDIVMSLVDLPILLEPISSRATEQCEVPAKAGARIVTLFEEARKALAMSLLAPPEGRPRASVAVNQLIVNRRDPELDTLSREVRSGQTSRPFQSLPPDLIAAVGYVSEEPDGTHYRGPDASVLLSSEFAASHCFALAGDSGASVGLMFEPTSRREDIVDIEGTMWLDRATLELRRVDFAYEGLRPPHDRWGLGGYVEFVRLPDGLWFENRWEIRMPRASSAVFRPDVLQVIRGEVLTLQIGDRIVFPTVRRSPPP